MDDGRSEPEPDPHQPPPEQLAAAMAKGPVPLVWGFRRARGSLPPAHVLMYHCDKVVPQHVLGGPSAVPAHPSMSWAPRQPPAPSRRLG